MRKLFISLLACLVSGIAGGIVAQRLAVLLGAGEEFILVFAATGLIFLLAAIAFFAAQFFGPRGIDRTAIFLSLALAGILAVVLALAYRQATPPSLTREDLTIIGSVASSGVMLILAHWLVVRLLQR